MEEAYIKSLWQSATATLDEIKVLSRANAADIAAANLRSSIHSLTPVKLFTIGAGILWVGFVDTLIINLGFTSSDRANLWFVGSAAVHSIITTIAIGLYLYQLILIQQVDTSEPVVETQEKLTRLKSSTLMITRILFLQLPAWTTFYLHEQMFTSENALWLVLQAVATTACTGLSIWLFFNIKYENRNKAWLRLILRGKEWDAVMRAAESLRDIEHYRAPR
jgi:hypothetical protein